MNKNDSVNDHFLFVRSIQNKNICLEFIMLMETIFKSSSLVTEEFATLKSDGQDNSFRIDNETIELVSRETSSMV